MLYVYHITMITFNW